MTFEKEFEEALNSILSEFSSERLTSLIDYPMARDDVGAMHLDEKLTLLVNVDKASSRPLGKKLRIMSWFDYGRYSVFQNLTDILSSSGKPIAFSMLLQLSEKNVNLFKEIMRGVLYELVKYRIKFLGGDTKPGKNTMIVGNMIGIVEREKYSPRWNAKPKDAIYLTGYVGLFPLAGYILGNKKLACIFKHRHAELKPFILTPYIPWKEANLISYVGANSGIDISDGLAVDLYKIAEESKVSMRIFKDKIPLHSTLSNISKMLDIDPYSFIFNVGGDWQICYTISPVGAKNIEKLKQREKLMFPTIIGEIIDYAKDPIIEIWEKNRYLGVLKKRGHLKEFEQKEFVREISDLVGEKILG
jgi:thiamine-monophosphate kinase